jgi:prepilin-type N-terminal cleavage/methylation domain-containing protein
VNHSARGFTLIELSIVLVIIGLIVGGVLVGQTLIAAAAVRAQISQLEKYSTAVNTFRGKYDDLPGDIAEAKAQKFGFPSGGSSWLSNGDGSFNSTLTPTAYLYTATDEQMFFWPDLSKAGLIEGQMICPNFTTCPGYPGASYTGVSLSYPNTVGTYFPAMKLNANFGILPVTLMTMGGNWWFFGVESYNYSMGQISFPSLTPAQAFALDRKMDDGVPSGGVVRILKNPGGADPNGVWETGFNMANDDNIAAGFYVPANCVANAGKTYNTSNPSVVCSIFVKMQ